MSHESLATALKKLSPEEYREQMLVPLDPSGSTRGMPNCFIKAARDYGLDGDFHGGCEDFLPKSRKPVCKSYFHGEAARLCKVCRVLRMRR